MNSPNLKIPPALLSDVEYVLEHIREIWRPGVSIRRLIETYVIARYNVPNVTENAKSLRLWETCMKMFFIAANLPETAIYTNPEKLDTWQVLSKHDRKTIKRTIDSLWESVKNLYVSHYVVGNLPLTPDTGDKNWKAERCSAFIEYGQFRNEAEAFACQQQHPGSIITEVRIRSATDVQFVVYVRKE